MVVIMTSNDRNIGELKQQAMFIVAGEGFFPLKFIFSRLLWNGFTIALALQMIYLS